MWQTWGQWWIISQHAPVLLPGGQLWCLPPLERNSVTNISSAACSFWLCLFHRQDVSCYIAYCTVPHWAQGPHSPKMYKVHQVKCFPWTCSSEDMWPFTMKWVVMCQAHFYSSKEFAAGVLKCWFWDFGCNCLRNRLSLVCNTEIAHFSVFCGQKHDFLTPPCCFNTEVFNI